jgi:hypothetical protein
MGLAGRSRAKAIYDPARVTEELTILQARWPQLQPAQRTAILRLLDSF